jgi:hypothetical protein
MLKNLILLIMPILCVPALAQAESCGYKSKAKLFKAADQILSETQNLDLEALETSHLPADLIFQKISSHPLLQTLNKAGYLKAEMDPAGSNLVYPAYMLATKTILIPESWYQFKQRELGNQFPAVFSMVMCHEFGHTVFETLLLKSPKFKKLGDPRTMKGHILVDGIAMRLMDMDNQDFAELMGLASYGGAYTYDIADRQKCIMDLK